MAPSTSLLRSWKLFDILCSSLRQKEGLRSRGDSKLLDMSDWISNSFDSPSSAVHTRILIPSEDIILTWADDVLQTKNVLIKPLILAAEFHSIQSSLSDGHWSAKCFSLVTHTPDNLVSSFDRCINSWQKHIYASAGSCEFCVIMLTKYWLQVNNELTIFPYVNLSIFKPEWLTREEQK